MIGIPASLPDLRREVRLWAETEGARVYRKAIASGHQHCRPVMSDDQAAVYLASQEAERLRRAELYYVSEPMTRLAQSAGRTLPVTLLPDDLPSPYGLVVFAVPIGQNDAHPDMGPPSQVVAAAWGPMSSAPEQWPTGGLWIDWYVDKQTVPLAARSSAPRLFLDNDAQVPFSADPIDRGDPETESTYPFMTLLAVWMLLGQTLATAEEIPLDRATRKRAARAGEPEPRVRIIDLRARRRAGSSESQQTAAAGRDYHHQWVVRGHWRQQWYPSREAHRPVWISPYIKGPEDAPLIGGEKVYALRR